ncbi:monosaccharide ABC transporter substrate-binding protein (CUT2 family) [Actinomadura pelletieri DSM 43383]|uniref:Monosaccharide ABC transporter substrate-binding protein (CUT2 family) n=1 Tax=Actinomadura pelletieri DSM 43383 TaxID=1120940 RepID=A0A495QZM8_9ACTN|nr:ABC transporter substrate-binding protein [Actinomadura pelletieri]RKS79527.1 monosaccharide ABC transporter substrate-binding protein (CUT2 family) [Actinomadura pelletieri DSM 43383]
MIGRFTRAAVAVTALGALTATAACGVDSGDKSSSGDGGGKSKALKVGWSTIYLTPSWMQQTDKMIKDDVAKLKGEGKIADYQVFNANGDTSQQIAQIRAMIQQKYDVILVDAGSSTALNPAMEQAVNAGITVANFDSLVTSEKVVRVGTDQKEWGRMMGQWLGEKLGGKGKIIAFNGPAGVAVSEERWQGAQEALKKFPDIKVAANVHSEYNLAPAAQAFASAYSANPDIDGVFSQGGALSAAALQTLVKQKKKMVPITGENYNGFLKLWKEQKANGFSSLSTAQPNYLGVIALRAAVAKAGGATVPNQIMVPLPKITDDTLDQYVKADQPDDSYPIQPMPQPEIDKLIGQ